MNMKFPWIEQYRTGWLKNTEDPRDYDYASSPLIALGPLPLQVDLFYLIPKVLHQGNVPSCVAHAIAHQIMIEEHFVSSRHTVPSRAFIYAMARSYHQTELRLTGTFPRLAYKAISKVGCPAEKVWPYSTRAATLNTKPPEVAVRYGIGRANLTYYTIQRNRSARIRQALAGGHPVAFGTQITDHVKNYEQDDLLRKPDNSEPLIGGHYMLIVGYKSDYFIIMNSWKGKERMLFHESYIEWDRSDDFTVITGWNEIRGTR